MSCVLEPRRIRAFVYWNGPMDMQELCGRIHWRMNIIKQKECFGMQGLWLDVFKWCKIMIVPLENIVLYHFCLNNFTQPQMDKTSDCSRWPYSCQRSSRYHLMRCIQLLPVIVILLLKVMQVVRGLDFGSAPTCSTTSTSSTTHSDLDNDIVI